jgi:23S rRNA (pseudouridine1915-N3)-methyltransferase
VKVRVLAVGKLKESYLRAAEEEYAGRLGHYCTLDIAEVADDDGLLAAIPPGARLYALDERGDQLSSAELARDVIGREENAGGNAPVIFAIGGADGHSEALRRRAKRLLAFGRITIAHRLCRILLLEQLYRAFTILRGEPYHRA